MATAAILKNLKSIDTTTHGGQQSCKVLLSLDKWSLRNCADSFTGEEEEK